MQLQYVIIPKFNRLDIINWPKFKKIIMTQTFSALQKKLLQTLSDNQCHSGQQLADNLEVSRTAIWKHISTLSELGLDIERIPKQGYRLNQKYTPLDADAIHQSVQALHGPLTHKLESHVFAAIPSTNQMLKSLSFEPEHIYLCTAEKQTKGRGRFNRYWHSPFGENIYCSLGLHFPADVCALSGLSLVISLAMHEVLQRYVSAEIKIKWPNDLIFEHQKIAGILIELTGEGNGSTDLIIGMGININSTRHKSREITKPWCSLHDITGKYFDRNHLIAELVTTVHRYLLIFESQGFKAFHDAWNRLDYLNNQKLTIEQASEIFTGFGRGVDSMGYLLIENDKGVIHTLSSGDTSLHQAYQAPTPE